MGHAHGKGSLDTVGEPAKVKLDARGNIINNNMNVLLKNLTIINVVFLPLGLFASMGGMSEYSLMLASFGVSQGVGYMLFSVVMVAVGLIFWALLRRRNGSG